MGMDWGPWGLQRKRSWRYGKARGRLLRFHPGRRGAILRKNPELLVYPVLAIGIAGAVGLAAFGVLWPLVACAATLAILRVRNRRHERPWAVLLSHFIYAAALLRELAGACVTRNAPVLHAPQDPDLYLTHLIEALGAHGVRCGYWTGPTRSQTVNTFLYPFQAPLLRLRGVRIVHFHWLFQYDLPWARRSMLIRRVMRWLFAARLWSLRACGIRIVWTAHNLLPHTPIFDNDVAARRNLVGSGAVIAHNDHAATEVRSRFAATDVHVIAQGITPRTGPTRAAARDALDVDPDTFLVVCVGRVEAYKRFDDVLHAAAALQRAQRPVAVRIVGACTDPDVLAALTAAASVASAAGVDVHMQLERVDDTTLDTVIAAANIVAYPFESITNSGSVLLALRAGRAALIRDLDALGDLPDDAVIRADHGVDGVVVALQDAFGAGDAHLDALGAAGAQWTSTRTWDRAAEATRAVYEGVVAT
jgi:glycosyltransferase involved in cell wall biosynthesis